MLDGTTARFSLWHGPIDPTNQIDFSLHELAEYEHDDGTELVAKYAVGITNAKWMEGKRGGVDETDWSQGVLNEDEWGDGLLAVYGFRSKQGSLADSVAWEGDDEIFSTFKLDSLTCDDSTKACMIDFSRDIDARPNLVPGEEIYIFTASGLSTSQPSEWMVGNF